MREFARDSGSQALPAGAQAPAPHAASVAPATDRDVVVRRAEVVISNVLRAGVLLSAGILSLGVVDFYLRGAQSGAGLSDRPYPHSLAAVISGLSQGDPVAIIALGLLLLLATPVVRVIVSIFAFALERDWRYVAITLLVLAILIASFLLGKGGA